jgi:hypothetical protein
LDQRLFVLFQGPELIRVSRFYKEAKEGKFVSYVFPDTKTLYESFRRGAKESSESHDRDKFEILGKGPETLVAYVWFSVR